MKYKIVGYVQYFSDDFVYLLEQLKWHFIGCDNTQLVRVGYTDLVTFKMESNYLSKDFFDESDSKGFYSIEESKTGLIVYTDARL